MPAARSDNQCIIHAKLGRDDPSCSLWRGCDGAEQRPVGVVEYGSVNLAGLDGELVAKHDDLEVLGTTRADRETGDHGDESVENEGHSWSASAAFPLISAHDGVVGARPL
ncbi:MAG: hypothetical protein ACKV2O_10355 [Acidimicrobiales bacterium]